MPGSSGRPLIQPTSTMPTQQESRKDEIELLIRRARKTHHGFTDIKKTAEDVVARHSARESLSIARSLLASEHHQARMLAVFTLGWLSPSSAQAFSLLHTRVSRDPNWRVQEILAQAFDHFCATIGYKQALPIIKRWLSDKHPNVRRAVTEGLRIWTKRSYFSDHPAEAVRLLSDLRADQSDYVRRSVGNALRDISRTHRELVSKELQHWDCSDKSVAYTYQFASRLLKSGP